MKCDGFVFKMVIFVFKLMHFVFKIMILGISKVETCCASLTYRLHLVTPTRSRLLCRVCS